MRRGIIYIMLMMLSLSMTAQKTTQKPSDAAEIERLTKVMYQFFSTDSVERFMSATDSLMALCRKTGDEVTFYKAWSNQASYNFTKVNREKGLAIAKEERAYAEKHDSKFGLYAATNSYATMMSGIGMIDEAEKAFLQAIDYQRRFIPEENAAFQYIGLAKIEHNRHHYDKTVDYGKKALAEKGAQPIHQLHAYNYILFGLGELSQANPNDNALKQTFNEAYAKRKKLIEDQGLQDATGGIVNYYEAQVNGRYKELPELATKIVNKGNRLAFIASAWAYVGDYQKAYEAYKVFKEHTDSVNRAEIGRAASEYGVQLDLAKAENEMKDLRLANQEHREHIHHIIMGTVGVIAGIESELRIAREIQMGMVPRIFPAFPDRNDIDLYASITPAKEVGGDLYDFFMQAHKLYFCIGDVSGKGVPASLFMSVVVNLFRLVAKEGFPPEYIATRLNDTLASDNDSGMFCTLFIGEIDMRSYRLNYCNAGHNAPLIIDRPVSPSDPCRPNYIQMESNAPIGLWPNLEFVGEHIDNVKDRTLFFYTDGITEAENSSHEQFGEKRLYEFFKSRPFKDARQTVDLAAAAVTTFVGDTEANDDQTMLCIKV